MKKFTVIINLMFLGTLFFLPAASPDWILEGNNDLYELTTGPHMINKVNLISLYDKKFGKELQIRITFPQSKGKYPVIIWSHGATGTKDMYQPLIKHWVSHGYICIQANHSDSRALGKKEKTEALRDWDSRPKDVSFIIDSLNQIEKKIDSLNNKINKNIIGVGGHSFGAHTAQLIGGVIPRKVFGLKSRSYGDPRASAFLLISPQGSGGTLDKDAWNEFTRPAMTVTGSRDFGRNRQPWEWRLEPFESSPPQDKYLVFIQEAQHDFGGIVGTRAYTNAGPENRNHLNYVKSATTAFWDAYLKQDKQAKAFLNSDALERASQGKANVKVRDQSGQKTLHKPEESPFNSTFEDVTWTDKIRQREVPVRIYAPPIESGMGPYPVIVFSHGGGESRGSFTYLGEHWAQQGYISIFVTHKGSDRSSLNEKGFRGLAGVEDFPERPADLSFVIDQLLSEKLDHKLLKGRINPGLIAAAGQCAGSTTALAMVGLTGKMHQNPRMSFRDKRVKAAVALSPQMSRSQSKLGLTENSWAAITAPVLVITGTEDYLWLPSVKNNPEMRRMAYDRMPSGDKFLVDINGAQHHSFTDSAPYYPAGERDPRHHKWIGQAATLFLDGYLKGDDSAALALKDKELETLTKGHCQQEYKPYDFSSVDSHIEKSLDRIGGGCSLILIRGNRVIYRKAFGTFTEDKVVPIASASKWISGGVIMALVDEGKINLDDTASKYLPEFTGKKADITIRHMFSHTHGLPQKPTHHWNTRLTMEEAVKKIAQLDLIADPGTALYYSGTGMQTAGRICEVVTGKPWVEIFKEKIGDPLEMESTSYYAYAETRNPNVAGSVKTCIDDYGHFVMMVLNQGMYKGKQILAHKAVTEMLTNQTDDLPIQRSACARYADFDPEFAESRYGIGCWLEKIDPKTGVAHEATSGGAYGCIPFVDIDRNLAGVYLPYSRFSQTMKRNRRGEPYNDASAVFLEIRPLIRAALDGISLPPKPQREEKKTQTFPSRTLPDDINRRINRMFMYLDKDKDGSLSRKEMPERLRRLFPRIDTDRNGKVSKKEMAALLKIIQRRSGKFTQFEGVNPGSETQSVGKTEFSQKNSHLSEEPYQTNSIEKLILKDPERPKNLQLRITYPEEKEKFPVIIFSHYHGGSRHDYQALIHHWVKNGYVVIQADHSDSRELQTPSPKLDWPERTRDMSFVIDSFTEIEHQIPDIKGKMDFGQVGAGGHLIGAYSACVLAGQRNFNPGSPKNLKDTRVQAVLLLSPQGRGQGLTEKSWDEVSIPMMVLSGSQIPSRRTHQPAEWRKDPFLFSPPGDKYLVWIDSLDRMYAGLINGEGVDETTASYIKEITLAFWDSCLKKNKKASLLLNPDAWLNKGNGKIKITAK